MHVANPGGNLIMVMKVREYRERKQHTCAIIGVMQIIEGANLEHLGS